MMINPSLPQLTARAAFGLAAEQEQIRQTVQSFLADRAPMRDVRRMVDLPHGFDPAIWHDMADSLGLQGLLIPETSGGQGLTFVELAIVLEELGATLLPSPYLATTMATIALLQASDERSRQAYLPGIARGATIATIAVAERPDRWDEESITLEAVTAGNGVVLNGSKTYVLDGTAADLLLVAARSAAGVGLYAIEAGSPGLTVGDLPSIDLARRMATLRLANVPAHPIGPADNWAAIQRVLDAAAIALAAEQLGGARRCVEMSVGYARDRVQFGQPIGAFQAIKHKCADIGMAVYFARSAVGYAAWAMTEQSEEIPRIASLVKAHCSEMFVGVAAETIQIHGGIGYTWEHDAHLYYKRATWSNLFLGQPRDHRERLATLLEL